MKSAQWSGVRRFLGRTWHLVRWPILALIVIYIAAVVWYIPRPASKEKTDAAVAAIHAQHLTLADVDGKHLPPEPDPIKVDATVEGIDANNNGIRDDVELAIFNKYPDSPKIRAAELQYAKAMELDLRAVFNSQTLVAALFEQSRGYLCVDKVTPPSPSSLFRVNVNQVENLVFNTDMRKIKEQNILNKYMASHANPESNFCDLYNN